MKDFMIDKIMRTEILHRKHKYWNALEYRLYEGIRANGCDCTHIITRRILMSLPNIDIEETLYYLSAFGGYCDCEIYEAICEINS